MSGTGNPRPKTQPSFADNRLTVAFALACKAHENDVRESGGDGITHPMLVASMFDMFERSDFLRALQLPEEAMDEKAYQEKRVLLKAVALLHDVLEDKDEYKKDHGKFKDDLLKELVATCKPRTDQEVRKLTEWAGRVFEGVRQLTNDVKLGDKRTMQIRKAKQIEPEFRIIKSLDQTASMVEDILYSDPANKVQLIKHRFFAYKALDVSRACRGDNHDNPFHELNKRVFRKFRDFYKLARICIRHDNFKRVEQFSKEFDISHEINTARNTTEKDRINVHVDEVEEILNPFIPGLDTGGLASVTVSQKMRKVVGYSMVVSSRLECPANDVAAKLRARIEKRGNGEVETHGDKPHSSIKDRGIAELPDGSQIQYFTFKPPRLLDHFARMAKDEKIKAVNPAFYFQMMQMSVTNKSMLER